MSPNANTDSDVDLTVGSNGTLSSDTKNPAVSHVEKDGTLVTKFDAELAGTTPLRYPWHVMFILATEFCERFSYYGMKTVLTLYFLEVLLWNDDTTTLIYHLFSVLCYFTPIFGAMLADGFLGKFNTIFFLSLVYVGGLVLLTLSAVPPLNLNVVAGTACGLILIGFGTGGIKPVVPAYGGDQFRPGQEKQLEMFFSVYYFSVNAGSLIATFVTPILRSDVPCFGEEGCYPLAFGLPAGLLAIAILAFVAGRPFYRNLPSKQNIIADVFGVTFGALGNKFRARKSSVTMTHWLDYAPKTYKSDFVRDVKQLLPVLAMFIPLPMFWALFDQQGSRWTLQATRLDGRVTDSYYWKPDQVQIFNPVMILALIPIFEGFIFPAFERFKIPFKLLTRMAVGMCLAGVAFIVAGIVQMQIENTLPAPLAANTAELRIYNTLPCPMQVTGTFGADNAPEMVPIAAFGEKVFMDGFAVPQNTNRSFDITVRYSADAANCPFLENGPANAVSFTKIVKAEVPEGKVVVLVLVYDDKTNTLVYRQLITNEKEKPAEGRAQARFILPFRFNTSSGGGEVTLINRNVYEGKKGHMYVTKFDRLDAVYGQDSIIVNSTINVDQGKYEVYYPDEQAEGGNRKMPTILDLPNGGVYTVVLKPPMGDGKATWDRHDIVAASSISVFWQLPQYFIMTVGEVLFSVSGLAFAYSQAPATMKSVLQAGWLMAVAVGNIIVIIISGAKLTEDQATEFFIFAGLIFVAVIIFGIMVHFYKYVEASKPEAEKLPLKSDTAETDSL